MKPKIKCCFLEIDFCWFLNSHGASRGTFHFSTVNFSFMKLKTLERKAFGIFFSIPMVDRMRCYAIYTYSLAFCF